VTDFDLILSPDELAQLQAGSFSRPGLTQEQATRLLDWLENHGLAGSVSRDERGWSVACEMTRQQ